MGPVSGGGCGWPFIAITRPFSEETAPQVIVLQDVDDNEERREGVVKKATNTRPHGSSSLLEERRGEVEVQLACLKT